MDTLTSDTLHYKDKPTKCNSQASSTRGIGCMVNVASSRLPVPRFVGRFFYCLLVNAHSRYLYLQTLSKRVEISG